jgi:sugar phosphate isomerase/epimerase
MCDCFCDCFHMNIEEASIADSLREAGPLVGHVISPIATVGRWAGHTDFAPIADALREIGYNGYVAAEILPLPDAATAADQTMRAFRQFFRQS